MKHFSARVLSFIIVLALCTGMLAGFSSAAGSTVNTGTRHVVCNQLSSQAKAYYTGSYTWENLSALSGTATNSSVTACGSPLFNALHTLMSSTLTKTVSYSSLTSYWETTDRSGGSSDASLFYSDTISSSYNREHVWPKSRGNFYESGAGSDLHHLRPTDSTINSTRSNHTFGNVKQLCSSYSTKDYNGRTVLWYDGSYNASSCNGLVEVNDNIKGDVARILLYVYVTYGKSSGENLNLFTRTSSSGSGNSANDGNKVIYDLDTLLQWCQNDPVDTWEMSRNDCVQNVQGNRNVFIDYPEFAWLLFNRSLPSDYVTPSGKAMSGTTPTEPTTAPTEPTTAPTEPTTAPSGNEYTLTTSLKDGDEVIIYNAGAGKAMSEDAVSDNYRAGADVTVSNNKIVTGDSKIVWTVKASGSGYTFANDAGETLSATKGLSFATTDNVWAVNPATTANSVYIVSTTATGTSGDPKSIEWYDKYTEFSTYYYSAASEAIFAMQLFVKGGSTTPVDPTTAPTEPTTAPTEPTTAPTQPTTAPSGNEYVLTTSLKDGDEVVIYNAGAGMAMSEDAVSTNYRAGVAVSPSGNKIVTDDSKIVWKVAASGSGFTFSNDAGETLSATKGLSFATTDNVWAVNPATTANSVYIVSTTATGTSGDPKSIEWYDKYTEFSTYYYSAASEAIFAMQLFVKGGSTTPVDPTTAPTEPTTAPTEPTTAPTEPTTAPSGNEYVLTTSLKDGDEVVIYNAGAGMAMSEDAVSTNYRAGVAVTPSGNKIVTDDSKIVWKVAASGSGFTFANDAGETLSATKGLSFAATDNVWAVNPATTASSVYLVSTTAVGTSGDPKYVEWYSNYSEFSTYYYNTNSEAIFAMQLFVRGGGAVTPTEPTTAPTEPTTAPTEPTTAPTQPTEAPDGSFVLSSSIKNGDEVVIYSPGHGMAIKDENDNNWYLVPEAIQPTGNKIYEPSSALVWTVVDNGNGTYSFVNGADKIVCWVSGNYFELTNDPNYDGADANWKVTWTDGLAYIQHATFSNSYGPAYIECYYNSNKDKTNVSGYSSSDPTKKSADFGWQFFVKNGGGSVTPTTPTNPTNPTSPTEPTEPFTPTGGCQHTYVETKVAATCTEPGYILHKCSKCGDSYRTDFTDLASHNYVNGVCANCGAVDPNYNQGGGEPIDPNAPLYASFVDLDKEGWYRFGIDYCLQHSLMNGVGRPGQTVADHFEPNGKVTRAMLVTIVYRMAGEPNAKGLKMPFEDVESGVWYTSAVAWAADQEIVKGVSEDMFAPNRYITREQLAAILYRYAGEPEAKGNLAAYPDAGKVTEYALDAMKWAIGEGIITGLDSHLAPQEYATRAQIATMIFRFLDPEGAKAAQEILDKDPNPFD